MACLEFEKRPTHLFSNLSVVFHLRLSIDREYEFVNFQLIIFQKRGGRHKGLIALLMPYSCVEALKYSARITIVEDFVLNDLF